MLWERGRDAVANLVKQVAQAFPPVFKWEGLGSSLKGRVAFALAPLSLIWLRKSIDQIAHFSTLHVHDICTPCESNRGEHRQFHEGSPGLALGRQAYFLAVAPEHIVFEPLSLLAPGAFAAQWHNPDICVYMHK